MGSYVLDNGWARERERLSALESVLDPGTTRHLDGVGVRRGFTCLEVAGGGGSIAAWLCKRVGRTGKIVATDIDTRFLDAMDETNLQVLRHDVVADDLPEAAFDLVHARLLLEHLPERHNVLKRLVLALKPGGVILIEDADWRTLFCEPPAVQVFPEADTGRVVRVWRALAETMCDAGYDREFGARLPGLMLDLGLEDVFAEARNPMYRGGTSAAVVRQLTLLQLRDRLLASGRARADEIDWAIERCEDPAHRALMFPIVAAGGRRPHGSNGATASAEIVAPINGMADRLGLLPVFAGCSNDELTRAAALASTKTVERSQVVVREGEPGDLFYVILRGKASVRAGRRKLASLGPGSFFGETALLTGGSRTATVKADTNMSLVAFDRDAFDQLLRDSPSAARSILEGMAERSVSTRALLWP